MSRYVSGYERQLRDSLIEVIKNRASDFNNTLHYGAALNLVASKFSYAEVGIVKSVLDQLVAEGVLWL